MIPNKSALCAPLNRITSSKIALTRLQSDTYAFRAVQKAFAEAVLLAFPDFDLPFHVYADASGKQLGGIVMQENEIIACYSRTLHKHQINYTTMQLELLSIVELLREYRTMLLGFEVIMHTDHKNLIYPNETSLRVKRWKLLLFEYRLSLHCIKCIKNFGADAFSRMRFDTAEQPQMHDELTPRRTIHHLSCTTQAYSSTKSAMKRSRRLILRASPARTTRTTTCLFSSDARLSHFKVVSLSQTHCVRTSCIWYHHNLVQAGPDRLYKTMRQSLYCTSIKSSIIKRVKLCLTCKRAIIHGVRQDYGLLPSRTLKTVNPWDVVHVDLIGPYDDYYGTTIIDQATRWLELGV